MLALTTRARVAIAEGDPAPTERDAHDALAIAASIQAYVAFPTFWNASALWPWAPAVTAKRHGFSERQMALASAWARSGSRSGTRATRPRPQHCEIPWARTSLTPRGRGRGQRKRPTSGWASLTPAERDVVRLVSKGLSNNDVATRLFVSPRTVQTHLTHVYTKLSLTSRVQLVQEAARHT
jgi:DNA-binding CsgD family transcriptional regulator